MKQPGLGWKWFWFVVLWFAGVASVSLVALYIKVALPQ